MRLVWPLVKSTSCLSQMTSKMTGQNPHQGALDLAPSPHPQLTPTP